MKKLVKLSGKKLGKALINRSFPSYRKYNLIPLYSLL